MRLFFTEKIYFSNFQKKIFKVLDILSSLNFPPLFPTKFAGKRDGKLSEERRYFIINFYCKSISEKHMNLSIIEKKLLQK